MWRVLELQPIASGCPNACRHCSEEGLPPFGALMSVDDVRWLVGELSGAWERTLCALPEVRGVEEGLEPTAHPDFLQLIEYAWSFHPESSDTLSTNGYGLARLDNWQPAFERLRKLGVRSLGMAVHGLPEEHDWFVRRPGAFRDLAVAAGRALHSGLDVVLEVHLNRRNIRTFGAAVEVLTELGGGRARLTSGVDGYYMNDRLRALEALRPTQAETAAIAHLWPLAPDRGSDTEANLTRQLASGGRGAGLCTYEPAGAGPEGRRLGCFRVTPTSDVIERFVSRPHLHHGNLKRDGADRVWQSVLDATLPPMPEPDELALTYGDFGSDLLYPGAESIHMKLCDRYWTAQA